MLFYLIVIVPSVLLLWTLTNQSQHDDSTAAFGWTYSASDWWFEDLRGQPAGYMGMIITYLDILDNYE